MEGNLEKNTVRLLPMACGYGRLLINSLGVAEDYQYLEVNPAFESLTGLKRQDILGRRASELAPGGDPGGFNWLAFFDDAARSGEIRETTQWIKSLKRYLKVTAAAEDETFTAVFQDVSGELELQKEKDALAHRLQILLEQMRSMRSRDGLTGLCDNRCVEKMAEHLDTEENLPISAVVMDINGLRDINDDSGRRAGDVFLRHIAETLKRQCRPGDLVARLGGGEFVIFMPQTAREKAEELIRRFKCVYNEESPVRPHLSFGCAAKESAGGSILAALRKAEECMCRQKLLDGKSCRSALLDVLLATLYAMSAETEEHDRRLGKFCLAMGGALRLSMEEMDELLLLAALHDIGKLGVEPQILKKPGALTPAEWEEVKRHPEIGHRILRTVPELVPVAELVLAHHERWDGKGYPHGLAGTNIPLACRILAVADSYDAMTNDRAYRKAMGQAKAMEEIRVNAGTQFDPEIAALFCRIHGHCFNRITG